MLLSKKLRMGKLDVTVYDFETVGDVLPTHTHTEDDVHITIVARGSFKAKGSQWEKTLKAGDVVDWKPFESHEFVALENESRIVNIIKS